MILLNSEIDIKSVALVVGIIIIVTVIVMVKQHFDEKKGVDSDEKKDIEALVRKLAPEGQSLTAAYASWQWTTYQGRTTTTKYWYYAIGFNEDALYVVPLSFAGGDMSYGDCWCVKKEELGIVNGIQNGDWIELYDKNQEKMIQLMVKGSNTRDDQFHPVNIQQQDAAKAFQEWRNRWMEEVNAANNVTVTGKIGKPVKKNKKGIF